MGIEAHEDEHNLVFSFVIFDLFVVFVAIVV